MEPETEEDQGGSLIGPSKVVLVSVFPDFCHVLDFRNRFREAAAQSVDLLFLEKQLR